MLDANITTKNVVSVCERRRELCTVKVNVDTCFEKIFIGELSVENIRFVINNQTIHKSTLISYLTTLHAYNCRGGTVIISDKSCSGRPRKREIGYNNKGVFDRFTSVLH